jgi:hypothetical protein
MRAEQSTMIIGIVSLALVTIAAQARMSPREGWQPVRGSLSNAMTAADKAAATSKLQAILLVFKQVPELADPRGLALWPVFNGGTKALGLGGVEDRRNVFEYGFDLGICDPSIREGGCGSIDVRVNFSNLPGGTPIHDLQGRAIYVEAARGDAYRAPDGSAFSRETVPLATETYYKLSPLVRSWVEVLLTADNDLPWTPVTREEYYNASIFEFEGKNGAKMAEFRKANETSAYQQWLAGAAQRRKEREAALAAAKGFQSPAEIEKMRKSLEDADRQTGDQLKAAEAADPDGNRKAVAASYAYGDAVRAELATMTPAERRMPALIDGALRDGKNATGNAVTDRDSPTVMRVFTPNIEFWRARKSPVEARGISVRISASSGGGPPPRAVHNVLWQTYKKLDWAALSQLLDHKR